MKNRPKKSRKQARGSAVHILVFSIVMALTATPDFAFAIETSPSPEQVQKAIERGIANKDNPEKIFKGYEFGKHGVVVNGYIMTKLFQITQRAATLAKKGKPTHMEAFQDILEKDHLLIPIYLVADSKEGLQNVQVTLRQGLRTIKADELLKDPPEKVICKGADCVFKRDIYAGFYYRNFDPNRLTVIVVTYGKINLEYPMVFTKIK